MSLLNELSAKPKVDIASTLMKLNKKLLKRARIAGVPIAPIEITGAGDNPNDQLEAILTQYNGLVERLAIKSPELPKNSK